METVSCIFSQGHLDAAEIFQAESGTGLDPTADYSKERMHIRSSIEHGMLEDAIAKVNDFNPEVRRAHVSPF
jgi:hypothetical protein